MAENHCVPECCIDEHSGDGISLIQLHAGRPVGKAGSNVFSAGAKMEGSMLYTIGNWDEQTAFNEIEPEQHDETGSKQSQLIHESNMYNPYLWKKFTPLNCTTDRVMLYTLGKTGTSTLHKTIKAVCGWGTPYQESTNKSYHKGLKPQTNAEVARDFLSKIPENGKVWIVTLVRNPFQRIPSAFFQTLAVEHGYNVTVQQAVKLFHEYLPTALNVEKDFFYTYDNVTGVDPFSQENPFEHEAKHMYVQKDGEKRRTKLLVLRMEDIDYWPRILVPYLGHLTLVSKNEASSKWYDDLYQQFQRVFKYTPEEVALIKQLPELKFYTPAEISKMLHDIKIETAVKQHQQ